MNIYEVLLKVVRGDPFTEYERATAVDLIGQLEQLNVLGTMARFLDPATHTCKAGDWWPATSRCDICSVPMAVPPHACERTNRWSRWGPATTECRICGQEML